MENYCHPAPDWAHTLYRQGGVALSMTRVRVRRERPTALALAVALCVTMLVVYVLTLDVKGPDVVESMAAAPRVTKEIAFDGLTGWVVSMAACESPQAARLQASAWVSRGAAGCVYPLDGQWRVLGALYDSRKAAERVSKRLAEDEGISAEVVPLEARGLTLRVTAPQAQIDALSGADALLRQQINQLGQVALQLDRRRSTRRRPGRCARWPSRRQKNRPIFWRRFPGQGKMPCAQR